MTVTYLSAIPVIFQLTWKKQLKEHQRKHSDDCAYQCKICNKGFHYRSGLKRHRDREHKE